MGFFNNFGNWIYAILLVFIFFLGFLFFMTSSWNFYDSKEPNFEVNSSINYENQIPEVEKPNIESHVLYWPNIPIEYEFSKENPCSEFREKNIIYALEIIEENTDNEVAFKQTEIGKDKIVFSCPPILESENGSGIGGINSYGNTQQISSGIVGLYIENLKFKHCRSYPSLEIHEILHAMGFAHSDSLNSIMFHKITGISCVAMDQEILNCLKHIYSSNPENYTCQGIPFL